MKPQPLGLQHSNDVPACSHHAEVEGATDQVSDLKGCAFGFVFREQADGIQDPKFIVGQSVLVAAGNGGLTPSRQKHQAHEFVYVANCRGAVLIGEGRVQGGKHAFFSMKAACQSRIPWRTRCEPAGNRDAVMTPSKG